GDTVWPEVYCPTEATFTFLENVLTEVMELFPSEYIHIGGDECPKTKWKESAFCQQLIKDENLKDEHGLQSYFIRRMEQFLNKNGRQIIGWDEILEGGLAPNATVMSWRGEQGGIEAAKQGHDVIMSPTSHCYLDYYQFQHPEEPLAIGGYLPIEKVYSYHPIPEELSEAEAAYVKGVQGNLWTEYIPTPEKAEYMAFPRGLAIAEIGWTKASKKDFGHFVKRLEQHLKWLERENVNAANPLYHIDAAVTKTAEGQLNVQFNNLAKSQEIRYTTDGSAPTAEAKTYSGPVVLDASGIYTGQAFTNGNPVGRSASITYNQHLASDAVLSLEHAPSIKYNAGGPQAVINGIKGSDEKYGDKEWLGFEGDDFIANIDLQTNKDLQEVQFRFFNGPGQWIYPPKEVQIFAGNDPENLELVATQKIQSGNGKIVNPSIDLKNQNARYLKIQVPNYGVIPEGRQGGGNRAWLFIDEIILL
ncbi:MAG: family 20 glycosylhydrolase, partial [Bacteroidota bacterium]